MEILSITKANVIKAYNATDKNGQTLLTNLFGDKVVSQKITDRIKTFQDACEAVGIKAEHFAAACDAADDTPDEHAYKYLKIVAEALNEGWKPNWNDSSEAKWYPYFNMDTNAGVGFSYTHYGRWHTFTSVGSRLCFKSKELAEYAGKQFNSIYKDFLTY